MRQRWSLVAGLCLALVAGCDDDDDAAPVDAGDQSLDAAPDPDAGPGPDAAPDPDAAPEADAALEPDAAPLPESLTDIPVEGPGPFAVGFRQWETTYVVPGTGEARTIPVLVWYPAERVDGPAPSFTLFSPGDTAVVDAPAAPPIGETYPVYAYSHGHLGVAGDSTLIMGRFASQGWVAVAGEHVGNLPGIGNNERAELAAHRIERPADIGAALDALDALPADDLLSRADTSRVVLGGHSRGAYTVWAAAGATFDMERMLEAWPDMSEGEQAAFEAGLGEDRLVGAVALDGAYGEGFFGADGHAGVQIPMMALSGLDRPEAMQATFDLAAGVDMVWVEIAGALHQCFNLTLCGGVPNDVGLQIISSYVIAFARHHVLGDEGARVVELAEGRVELTPAVTTHRRD